MPFTFASSVFLLLAAASPTVYGATRRELASMPWDSLEASLPSGATQLQEATYEGWARDCLPVFVPVNPFSNRSTYYLIDQPSGLCMAAHWCNWERCSRKINLTRCVMFCLLYNLCRIEPLVCVCPITNDSFFLVVLFDVIS